MVVRVRAGTTVAELAAVTAARGQFAALEADQPERATVGGVLAVGRSGLRRLGWGPVRDAVLEVTAVTAEGRLIRAGAPLVKNVTGFDLARLFVSSIGTLALLAEVVLRCRPLPEAEVWFASPDADPFAVAGSLYRPLSVLWDGTTTWVGLSGYRSDIEAQRRSVLGASFTPVSSPPARPGPHRCSVPPARLAHLPAGAGWLAEIGVGVVHCSAPVAAAIPAAPPSAGVASLHRHIKERFDPEGRLNPGRSPLRAAEMAVA
jgi:glycolate oxidase FAD binding subunit